MVCCRCRGRTNKEGRICSKCLLEFRKELTAKQKERDKIFHLTTEENL